MKNNVQSISWKKSILFVGAGVVLVAVAFGVGAVAARAGEFTVFPNQFHIDRIDVSGLTKDQARALVKQQADQREAAGLNVRVPNYGVQHLALQTAGKKIIAIDVDATIESAVASAQNQVVLGRIKDAFGLRPEVTVDEEITVDSEAQGLITEQVAAWHVPLKQAQDAKLQIVNNEVQVVPEVVGETIDTQALLQNSIEAMHAHAADVAAAIVVQEPIITSADAQKVIPSVKSLVSANVASHTLQLKDKKRVLTSAELLQLLQPRVVNGEVVASIDPQALKNLVGGEFASLEQPAKDALFERQGNKVTKFVAPQTGVAIDWGATATILMGALEGGSQTITLATQETQPAIPLEKTNDLGIKEVLGVGSSDFPGSPANRIHNITVGMNSVNGTLIAPGETFSLIKTLGRIDAGSGYLQELVIKDNKTMPEYGGGLCQIGTTTFRAAMGAGFPILERRNHSYQVSYYFENGVSGTDATIYDPKPDLRFQNDTDHWVMFETRMKGSHLDFIVWGTKDGREASRTIPKVLATQPAPPKKLIETTDLPAGKVKCTEHAHAGATTLFTYTVKYPDGTTKKQDFQSYYKPWGEVCLIGVTSLSQPAPAAGTVPSAPPTLSSDAAGATGN